MVDPKASDASSPNDRDESSSMDQSSSPFANPLDLSNTMLGEFRMLRKLGEGGMAEVYLADQTTLRRQVAVKVLRPQHLTDEQYIKRFRHEAAAAGSLNHPNIVQVYMVGDQNGRSYIAQEYVQGRTLKQYMKRKGPLEFRLALHILRQIASALQVASENGIVHRDIKPENILLTSKGEAKVADFGLAQLTLQGERVSLTQAGMTMGTPLYMSPEQVHGQPLDARSDIYSLGIMAWHMLAGRAPFTGETAMAIAVKHLNEKPPQLLDFRPDTPKPIVDFIQRLIEKKKENRPENFAVVVTEIKRLIRQVSDKDDTNASISISAKRTPLIDRPFRQQIGWLIAASLLVMASTAGIGWAMRTPELKSIASTGTPPMLPKMPTAAMQLLYAQANPSEEARWIAVKEYTGVSDEIKAHADSALAVIYLKSNRRPQAEAIFRQLEMDTKTKADCLAGLALIAHIKGDDNEARSLIGRVEGMKGKLFPELEAAFKDLQNRLANNK